MPKKKSPPPGNDEIYTLEIAPLIRRLKAACKARNFTLLVAVSVPLTQNTGVTMLDLLPNASGQLPSDHMEAYRLLNASNSPPVAS